MFNKHKGRALMCNKKVIALAIEDASNTLIGISRDLFIEENRERVDLAQQMVLSLIQLDTAIEESYSRLYQKTFFEKTHNAVYHESLYKLGLSADQVFHARNLRGLRNKFCHTLSFHREMKKICKDERSLLFFQETIFRACSDLAEIKAEIKAIEEQAA